LQLRIGGGTGALIGGFAGRVVGEAVAGGLIGAAAGAIIADARRPGRCYYYTRKGYRRMCAALEARGIFVSNART
jgi:hypothetical protein